jgi:hypothetical protein
MFWSWKNQKPQKESEQMMKNMFLKGVRVVPNEFGDVPGSVWLHFGVSATIFDALTSLNKRQHEHPHWS